MNTLVLHFLWPKAIIVSAEHDPLTRNGYITQSLSVLWNWIYVEIGHDPYKHIFKKKLIQDLGIGD